ncbi:MAG: xanthine dehydrogenase small subunit [Betaproteobacteria bacterium RIFCSPLOWO2_02_FULL_65_20]|nr:MAG: xanthine dehydrogenase small subunit [Betaproteobacteria bacterium RIFCSPLOWO2_02_FULL_65_20]
MNADADSAATVRFLLDGEVTALTDIAPTRTVLQVLREDLGRTGSKEGCAEGDCGACTVVVAERHEGGVRYRAVNSCIQFAPSLDGKALITVESLKGPDGSLHPVQQAIVDGHASQCGFCTPGFVMSLFALFKTRSAPSRQEINDALAGNLCRCTGYRPIVDAAQVMYELARSIPEAKLDWMSAPAGSRSVAARGAEAEFAGRLADLERKDDLVIIHEGGAFHSPRTLSAFASLRERMPAARILAGGTDLGTWVTKQYRGLGDVLSIGSVAELKRTAVTATHIEIGAAVALTDAHLLLAEHYPGLDTLFRRFASPPIRNAGTLGGNIANGSPIGDSMPCLIALGATVVLNRGANRRELPLEALYLAYQRTAMEAGEFVSQVRVPLPQKESVFRAWKISKRFDQDISTLCGAFMLRLDGGGIAEARVAFGGMAATPRRAAACEAALTRRPWNEATRDAAMAALALDYQPIDDLRGTARYRMKVAQNLLRRLWLETGPGGGAVVTRLADLRGVLA